jgi:hypothetical protein
VFFRPLSRSYLKLFSIFLLLNFLFDAALNITAYYEINNTFYGSLSTVLDFTFYLYLVREIVHNPRAKKLLSIFMLIYPIVALTNIFFIQGQKVFHTVTYSLGCLLMVACCIYYFWELFQQSHSVSLSREPAFWICTGLLFYFACSFPIFGLTNYLMKALPTVILQNLYIIFILVNVFLYLSFIIAFLCRLKPRKSMS